MRRWCTHVLVAVLLGAGAGTGAALWLHHHRTGEREALDFPPHSDQLDAALAGLRRDGLYVSPDGQTILGPAGQQQVAAAIGGSPIPVYVAVLAPDQHIGLADVQISQALQAGLPDRRGVLLLWQGPGQGDIEVLGPSGGGDIPGFETATQDFVGDPATTLTRAVHAAAHTNFYADYGVASDYWGGVPGGSVLGALIAIGATLALLFLGWLVAIATGRRRTPGRWTWREDAP